MATKKHANIREEKESVLLTKNKMMATVNPSSATKKTKAK
jgi:hypothetical protein